MIKVLKIADLCTTKLPNLPPTMREVVKVLVDSDSCAFRSPDNCFDKNGKIFSITIHVTGNSFVESGGTKRRLLAASPSPIKTKSIFLLRSKQEYPRTLPLEKLMRIIYYTLRFESLQASGVAGPSR
ncbi:hypothetical protein SADUNF_Sadunf13G0083100 [Salix dunnii]|uniref:Uncharacterized protein n=1 Tax=Salix dunnii TaxID=1413687 RepID=A0A835JLE8_9ROSI|nr:hypothetical protein SADUNF_Sadunf13G0083100 [Salix dunnii]